MKKRYCTIIELNVCNKLGRNQRCMMQQDDFQCENHCEKPPEVKRDLLSVFVLLDCTEYEGSEPLCAFKHKEDAECLKAMAEDHDEKKPNCPDCMDDSKECNSKWAEYEEALQEWRGNHPIKNGFDGADFYSIAEMPLHV